MKKKGTIDEVCYVTDSGSVSLDPKRIASSTRFKDQLRALKNIRQWTKKI